MAGGLPQSEIDTAVEPSELETPLFVSVDDSTAAVDEEMGEMSRGKSAPDDSLAAQIDEEMPDLGESSMIVEAIVLAENAL